MHRSSFTLLARLCPILALSSIACRRAVPTSDAPAASSSSIAIATSPAATSATSAAPSVVAASMDPIELTTTDILKVPDFRAERARFFGLALGMTRAEVQKALERDARFETRTDRANPTRLYFYSKEG